MSFRSAARLLPGLRRGLADRAAEQTKRLKEIQEAERGRRLAEIYAPFNGLSKGSVEYEELSRSGRVWENYFRPGDSKRLGYFRLQKEFASTLTEIDKTRDFMKRPANQIAKQLVAEYAHQSVMIESNELSCEDSHVIHEELTKNFFRSVPMPSISLGELVKTQFPDLTSSNLQVEKAQTIELRNHIIASQWIAETALQHQGEDGLGEEDVRTLSAVTMKDLGSDGYYPWSFGDRVPLGHYRLAPLRVKSNPLAIFPYHVEVPSCMRRYFQWRKMAHAQKELHPLLLACHAMVYFLHIHPFPDGNGRVSRMAMHDYMVRQGYLPVYMANLERKDYLRMIQNAQDGAPDEFVQSVLTTQLDMLYSYAMEEQHME